MLSLTVPVSATDNSVSGTPEEKDENITNTALIGTDEILKLNDKICSMVDKYVSHFYDHESRAHALHDLMFGSDKMALKYDNQSKTAAETIESGSGNCISLTNAFIAMSRYSGLNVGYLHVEIPYEWQREADIYYQFRHISAWVQVSPGKYLAIEYEWMGDFDSVKTRHLTDDQGFGTFYSNRGLELLMKNDIEAAMKYLLRAVELDPGNSNNWTNLGVAYRRLNQMDKAEFTYQQALSKNKEDMSAINNLVILYQMTGRTKLAEQYDKTLENYLKKNPYYMIKLANQEIVNGNYSKALKWAQKAIKKNGEEHEFYYVAAKIYAYLGDAKEAKLNLELAEKYAYKSLKKNRYTKKLELLRNMQKAVN